MKLRSLIVASIALSFSTFASAEEKGEPYYEWKVENFAVAKPIGGKIGDPVNGRKLVVDQKTGNCIACHLMPIEGKDATFPGQIGPPLFGLGSRYTVEQIRLRVADEKKINPVTIMPGYYRDPKTLVNVKKAFRGKTVLTAQQVEDVVAFISTFK